MSLTLAALHLSPSRSVFLPRKLKAGHPSPLGETFRTPSIRLSGAKATPGRDSARRVSPSLPAASCAVVPGCAPRDRPTEAGGGGSFPVEVDLRSSAFSFEPHSGQTSISPALKNESALGSPRAGAGRPRPGPGLLPRSPYCAANKSVSLKRAECI